MPPLSEAPLGEWLCCECSTAGLIRVIKSIEAQRVHHGRVQYGVRYTGEASNLVWLYTRDFPAGRSRQLLRAFKKTEDAAATAARQSGLRRKSAKQASAKWAGSM